jgi:hypothetical protein
MCQEGAEGHPMSPKLGTEKDTTSLPKMHHGNLVGKKLQRKAQ